MNSGSKVLLGVLAGAATGAILGVLFAPEKGGETRRKLGESSKDIAGNLKEKFGELVDGIAEKYETAREGAADLIKKGKNKMDGNTATDTDNYMAATPNSTTATSTYQ